MEIKEENPLSDIETELFFKNVTMKRNSDTMLVDNDCDMAVKTEIKSETSFPDFCSQNKKECFTKHCLKQSKSEIITCSNNNWEIDNKIVTEEQTLVSDFSSQIKREFLPEDSVMKVKKYNSDCKVHNKIEIKEELWWLETGTSSVSDDIKDGDFLPVKSPRLCTEAVCGDTSEDLPLPSAEILGKGASFYNGKNDPYCESQESDVTEMPSVGKHVHSEQSVKCDEGEMYNRILCMKQRNLIKGKRLHKCKTCDKSFTRLSYLKMHNLIHDGKKPHQCESCGKSFTRLDNLKVHNLIHDGNKPHKCKSCGKSFIHLTNLKIHNLIHEGKKPHKCESCNKNFRDLSNLKKHKLIHENTKLHKCEKCEKTFTHLSGLRLHSWIHEGEKPHKCEICEKRFTKLSHLKVHNLIHKGEKPHKCEVCDKNFTLFSGLKKHNLIHEGKKPHECEICEKSFRAVSDLKRHNLIHEGKKPHECEICKKRFTQLSTLKRHSQLHTGIQV